MSTAASIYFFTPTIGIKHVQIQNISTTAVLYGHVYPLRLMPVQELKKTREYSSLVRQLHSDYS